MNSLIKELVVVVIMGKFIMWMVNIVEIIIKGIYIKIIFGFIDLDSCIKDVYVLF